MKTIEEYKQLIDEYFINCDIWEPRKPYAVSSLSLYLWISTRKFYSLLDNEEYKDLFELALTKIESQTEERLLTNRLNPVWWAFVLKNRHNRKDKVEVDNKITNNFIKIEEIKSLDLQQLNNTLTDFIRNINQQ